MDGFINMSLFGYFMWDVKRMIYGVIRYVGKKDIK